LQKSIDVSEEQTTSVCSLEGLLRERGNILQDNLKKQSRDRLEDVRILTLKSRGKVVIVFNRTDGPRCEGVMINLSCMMKEAELVLKFLVVLIQARRQKKWN